ncbi:hypothetical protein COW96_00190, partial [Candidatus Roizmanbacteria bacterium CG22_combo_CG10-13_8_21_14_all_33_16]
DFIYYMNISTIPLLIITNSNEGFEGYIKKFIAENTPEFKEINTIEPEKNEITIDQIRSIYGMIKHIPQQRRLIIIKSFDSAKTLTQNAILKLLEEKTVNTQFVLQAKNLNKIIDTIQSRVKVINLVQSEKVLDETYKKLIELIITQSKAKSLAFLNEKEFTNPNLEFINKFLINLQLYFLSTKELNQNQIIIIINKSFEYQKQLGSINLNLQLTLDSILIFIYTVINIKE